MSNLKSIEQVVYEILKEKEIAKSDDWILIGFVLKNFGVDLNLPLKVVLAEHKKFDIPSFESITRARRKIADKYPELFNKKIVNARTQEEKKYREYYKK